MNAFDPYYTWLGIPPEDQPADHYRLLGVKKLESNLDVISHAVDKQMMHLRSFQTGQHAQASQKLLNELAAVRICLLNPEKKAAYDQELSFRIKPAVPVLEVARLSTIPAANTAEANLPRALPLDSSQPIRPPRPSTVGQMDSVPEVDDHAPIGRVDAAKEQFPKWLLAVAGVAVIAVAGLAFLMFRSSTVEPPLAQGAGASPDIANKQPDSETAANAPIATDEKAEPDPDPITTQSPTESASPESAKAETPSAVEPVAELNAKDSVGTNSAPEKQPSESGTAASQSIPETPAEEPTESVASAAPEKPVAEDTAASTPASAVAGAESSESQETNELAPAGNTQGEEPAKKLPVPAAAEITRAEKLVKEIFGDDIAAAKTADQRSELASRMVQSADGTEAADAARYVLLTQATEFAAQAGNVSLIESACDNLAELYEVDVFKLKGRAYSDASKVSFDIKASGELCDQVLALADKAAAAQRFDLTQPLIKIAQVFARKVKNKDLFKQINTQSDRLVAMQSDFQGAEKAAKVLADKPDDAAANLAYGKYLALGQHDWEKALPLLVKSGHAQLMPAAEADLANPSTSTAQANLGDAWYTLANGDKSLEGFKARAHYWYGVALPTLTGLTKTRVEKRLDEIESFASPTAAQAGGAVMQGPITAKPRLTIPAHESHVSSLAFSPNGRMVASGSIVDDIKLWDVSTGELIKTLTGTKDIRTLVFSSDGKTLISAGGDYLGRFWAIPSGQMQREIKDCAAVAATADGKTLAVYDPHSGSTTLWDAASVQQTVVLEKASRYGPPYISKDGKILAAGTEDAIYVWNVQTGRLIHKLPRKASLLALSPDGKLLASTTYQGQLSIWNLATGAEKHTMKGDNDYVNGMAFSPDGGTLVTGGAAKVLRFWDPQSGKLRVDVPDNHGYISSVAFSPNGKTICTGSFSKQITLWDVEKLSTTPASGSKK